ncbi:antibiotic biosynthesis monooxygenase [Paraglaciecola sp. 20A4]|uniref:antibiotic biosynthesis monooxygenase n=1 Tax=Paraglaciecola sp. 20A4 TaxID=2687288 RepID=UPI00140821FB|nr:antibiotic biosynthesis monooxygenase [Paraglaciecola sp. 20A4]
MAQLIEAAKNELGTLVFEWSIGDNRADIHIYERYDDEVAGKVHLGAWGANEPDFNDMVNIAEVTVFSKKSQELQTVVAGLAQYLCRPRWL